MPPWVGAKLEVVMPAFLLLLHYCCSLSDSGHLGVGGYLFQNKGVIFSIRHFLLIESVLGYWEQVPESAVGFSCTHPGKCWEGNLAAHPQPDGQACSRASEGSGPLRRQGEEQGPLKGHRASPATTSPHPSASHASWFSSL